MFRRKQSKNVELDLIDLKIKEVQNEINRKKQEKEELCALEEKKNLLSELQKELKSFDN